MGGGEKRVGDEGRLGFGDKTRASVDDGWEEG